MSARARIGPQAQMKRISNRVCASAGSLKNTIEPVIRRGYIQPGRKSSKRPNGRDRRGRALRVWNTTTYVMTLVAIRGDFIRSPIL
jgi:hypothetical protein